MGQEPENESTKKSGVKRRWKLIRPTTFKIADEVTLERILNPPPRYPVPEFKGLEYIQGPENDSGFIFMCSEPYCLAKFTTALGLTLHSKKHADPLTKCQFCGVLFKYKHELISHCNEFHPNLDNNPDANPLQCKKCGKCSRDKKALWRHVRESHRDLSYPCRHCNFHFTRPENLREHLKKMHPAEEGYNPIKHICNICGREYRYQNSLRSHIRQVHRGSSDKMFRCVLCNTIYDQKIVYDRHMKRHTDPKVFPCHLCRTTYHSKSHLKRHEQSYGHQRIARKAKLTPSHNDLFPAPIIKTVKTVNPNLTKHELIELCMKTRVKILLRKVDQEIAYRSPAIMEKVTLGSKPINKKRATHHLNCIYCNKSLPDLKSVKVHEKICYMKLRCKKLIICPVCSKEFDRPSKLRKHIQAHQKEKVRPFQCSYCDACFSLLCTKTHHEKSVHFDIRSPTIKYIHKCPYEGCDKHYANHSGLVEHIASRHVVKKRKCDKCGRTFRTERILKRHVSLVHAECPILLQCKPCKRIYKDKTNYLTHLKRRRHARKTREYERERLSKISTGG